LDGIREEIITDVSLTIGGDLSLTLSQNIVKVKNSESGNFKKKDKVRNIDHPDFKVSNDLYSEIEKEQTEWARALEMCSSNLKRQYRKDTIILSDRGVSDKMAPIDT
jgi:glutamate synthase (ferredoxin)